MLMADTLLSFCFLFNNFYKSIQPPKFMIVKLMGVMDLFTALVILLFQYKMIHNPLVISLGLYLIMKAVIFFGDFFSIVDGIVGIYMLLMMFVSFHTFTFIVVGYLAIKGFSSLV
jgi:hypothetical protein